MIHSFVFFDQGIRPRYSITVFRAGREGRKMWVRERHGVEHFFAENFAYFFSNEKVGRRRQMPPNPLPPKLKTDDSYYLTSQFYQKPFIQLTNFPISFYLLLTFNIVIFIKFAFGDLLFHSKKSKQNS